MKTSDGRMGVVGRGLAGIGVMVALAACGGEGAQRAVQTPSEPPPSEPSSSGAAKRDGQVAPASSDDVKQGIVALKAGDVNGAKAAFEVAVQKDPKKADAHHYLGLVLDQTGNKPEAERQYRAALELDPGLEESAVNLAAILVEGGKFDEAAALMKKAIAKDPKNAALHVNLGVALAGKNDVDGASKAFDEALRIEPKSGITLVTYASVLAKANRKDEAVARLKQAEKASASDPGVLASVALEYKGLRDFKSCVTVLDEAIAVKDVAELRMYRGACRLGLKDLPGATGDFKDAVAKEPNNAVAHYSLGNALADGGKLPDAISEWETYLKLAPQGPQAKAAEKKIALAKTKAGGKKK
jgi:Flp pilus assembly protein TadD